MKRIGIFFAVACSALAAHAETLRIATFNLKWLTETVTESRMAPWTDTEELDEHRAAVAQVIAAVRADVLCVQEATSRAALERLVADPALRPLRYRILHVESEDTGTGQDIAFLVSPKVRLDTIGGRAIRTFADTLAGRPAGLKRADPRRARLTKHAVVCVESPKACLLGLHLLAHPDNGYRTARRETQARVAAHIARTEIAAKGYAPIVLGDFNDFDTEAGGPSSYATKKRRVLSTLMDTDTTRPGPELFNAALKIHPPVKRFSAYWDRNKNRRRDPRDPLSLIDHVLLDKSLKERITKVEIRHDVHDGDVSDHWPVVVEIDVK